MAIIIGNLTRDPEMRYTPAGHAVTSFAVATNRKWMAEGQEKEDVQFHNIVAWNKLAELCHGMLVKGTKAYIQGRLQTRSWDDAAGVKKYRTEIVAEEMLVLSSGKSREGAPANDAASPAEVSSGDALNAEEVKSEEVNAEEIPF